MTDKQKCKNEGISSLKVLSRTAVYIKPYWWLLLISIISSLALVGINLYLSRIISRLVENIRNANYTGSFRYMYILIALTLLGVVSSYLVKFASGRFSLYTVRDIRNSIYTHIEKINVRYIEKNHSGEIVSRLTNNIALLQGFLENNIYNLMYQPLLFTGAGILLLRINGKLLLVSSATMFAALFLAFVIAEPVKRKVKELHKDLARVNSVYQDNIRGIYLIKTYLLFQKLFEKYEKLLVHTLNRSLSIEKINSLLIPVGSVLSIAPLLVSIVYGGYLSIHGQLKPGELFAFIYLLDFLANSAGTLPKMISDYKSTIGVTSHLFEILDEPIEREGGLEVSLTSCHSPIVFKDVQFGYEQNDMVLNNISFELRKGKTTALVGSSGSGKSTIVKLICGFYQLSGGEILLWGENQNRLDLADIRMRISLVSQEIYILPGTVAENISYGIKNATMKDIIDAARAANAHEFIEKLPGGYYSMLGERGASLSGGQRQRIAIARAIMKKTDILLLDEPTSALDTHSEILAQKSIEKISKGCTVLVIAHRLSTIINADEILVIDGGTIVDKGKHAELLERNGLYRQLYARQVT